MIFRALVLLIALVPVAAVAATPNEMTRLIARVKAEGEARADGSAILNVNRGKNGGYRVICCLEDPTRVTIYVWSTAERYANDAAWYAIFVNASGQSNERWWDGNLPRNEWFIPYEENMQKAWQARADIAIRNILARR